MGVLRTKLGAARRRLRLGMHRVAEPILGDRKNALNARWRRSVIDGARDATAATEASLLVVAPHPDDETIGCAATIARRRRAETRVTVVVVSDGGDSSRSSLLSRTDLAELRREETRSAMRLLGVDEEVRFLSYDSDDLRSRRADLVAELVRIIKETAPGEILGVSRDDWSDEHRLVALALEEAMSSAGYDGIRGEYPVWHWDHGPSALKPSANPLLHTFVLLRSGRILAKGRPARSVVVGEFADLKREAFSRYATQVTNYTGEASWSSFPQGWLEKFVEREVFFEPDDEGFGRPNLPR